MDEPKHTPGPWKVFGKHGGHCVLGHQSDDGQIHQAVEIQTHNTPEGDTNIDLLRASPKLLAACKAARRFISRFRVPQDKFQAAIQIEDARKVLEVLNAAIAEAGEPMA